MAEKVVMAIKTARMVVIIVRLTVMVMKGMLLLVVTGVTIMEMPVIVEKLVMSMMKRMGLVGLIVMVMVTMLKMIMIIITCSGPFPI